MKNLKVYNEVQKIDISRAINGIVQYHKDNGLLVNATLMIHLNFNLDDYDNENHEYTEVFLYFHGMNYIKVAYSHKHNIEDGSELIFEADHDSCWRDGTDRIIRKIADDMSDLFSEDVDVSIFNSFGLFGITLLKNKKIKSSQESYETKKCYIQKIN